VLKDPQTDFTFYFYTYRNKVMKWDGVRRGLKISGHRFTKFGNPCSYYTFQIFLSKLNGLPLSRECYVLIQQITLRVYYFL
jgi:hypothetical protein